MRRGRRLAPIAGAAVLVAGCGSAVPPGGGPAAEGIARLLEDRLIAAVDPVPPLTNVTAGCREARTNVYRCVLGFEPDADDIEVDVGSGGVVEHTDAFRALPGTTDTLADLADAEGSDSTGPFDLGGINCIRFKSNANCQAPGGNDVGLPAPSLTGCFTAPPITGPTGRSTHVRFRFPAASMLSPIQLGRALTSARELVGAGTTVTWLEASTTELELVIVKGGRFGVITFETQGPPVDRDAGPEYGPPTPGFALGAVDPSTPQRLAGRIAQATGLSPSELSTVTAQTYGASPLQWSLTAGNGCRQFSAADSAAPITEWAAPGTTTTIG